MGNNQQHDTRGSQFVVNSASLGVSAVESGGAAGAQTLVIDGSGFGVGPNVVIFDRVNDQNVGEILNTIADVGNWKESGNTSFNNRPPVVEFGGRKAVTHNNPASGQGATRYGLGAGISQGVPDYIKYTEFYKLAVPAGKTFPGAATVETFPAASTCKVSWHTGYKRGGVADACDLVSVTHVGSGDFRGAGNTINGQYWSGFSGAWRWNEWNNIINIYSPDPALQDGLNGSHNLINWNSGGRYSSLSGAYKCWDYTGTLPSETPKKFDDIAFFSWSGNGDSHADSQLVGAQYYLAVGDNHEKYLLLANNADLALATNVDVVATDSWVDTLIEVDLSVDEASNNTHYFVMDNQSILKSGAI